MSKKTGLDCRLTTPDLSFERTLWEAGVRIVAGIDEAGRGAFRRAGPL